MHVFVLVCIHSSHLVHILMWKVRSTKLRPWGWDKWQNNRCAVIILFLCLANRKSLRKATALLSWNKRKQLFASSLKKAGATDYPATRSPPSSDHQGHGLVPCQQEVSLNPVATTVMTSLPPRRLRPIMIFPTHLSIQRGHHPLVLCLCIWLWGQFFPTTHIVTIPQFWEKNTTIFIV